MDKCLEKYNLPSMNQKEKENMNRQILNKEIESAMKGFPTNQNSGTEDLTGEFYESLEES